MSTDDDLRVQLAGQVRVLQVIVAAVALGPAVYLGVLFFMAPPGAPAVKLGRLSITYLACGFAVATVAARLFVPSIIVRTQRRQIAAGLWPPERQGGNLPAALATDTGKLGAVFSVRTLVAVALLEGGAFFLTVAYQQERDPLALAAAALLILVIAAHFPTREGVALWVERQLQRLDEARQMEQFRR